MDSKLFVKLKLLIVDDVEDVLEITNDILAEGFTHVSFAGSAEEAILKLKADTYLCMVLDLNLGSSNGMDVVKFLKKSPDNPNKNIPIIIISGYLTPEFIENHKDQFVGMLSKPFNHMELRKMVSDILFKTYPKI